jgi:hypothetical protein
MDGSRIFVRKEFLNDSGGYTNADCRLRSIARGLET